MEVILVLIVCVSNIIMFVLGARLGQKVANNEPININPIKAVTDVIDEHNERKEKEAENDYLKALMYNIDNYDGTGLGQKDIPRK